MRVMLDECMTTRASRLVVDALKLHKPPIEAHFLEDYLGAKGSLDTDWTQTLADEGGWCVITCDYRNPRGAKARSKGPPLHLILPSRKVTGFFFGGKIAGVSGFEKARAVIYTFPDIWQHAQKAPAGSRFKIVRSGAGYRFEPWPFAETLPTLSPTALPPPSELFPPSVLPSKSSPAPFHPSKPPTSTKPPQPGS
jgi:hypothetical protein